MLPRTPISNLPHDPACKQPNAVMLPSVTDATNRVNISTGAQTNVDKMLKPEHDSESWFGKAEVVIGKIVRARASYRTGRWR